MLIVHSHQVNLSSNQHDYISSHAKEFNRLVSSKELGLSYLLKQFESKEQNSLKEYIMATVCVEILGNENKGKEWSTGREWYMDYKKTTT
ncbi:hypothetical protein BACCIP111883_02308 [Sutcliffiella rhizosphaerae]|uniref:Uncharacterized protein n=2 Tax=Sutcliffiella rhizosphaerae TaxID=2880967 RepID=A0ABN8AFA4_9BACI|nr:hypothetical protein BACCIP111883_02308 [Sutcliffiella rhizosphaerae]